jgi:hypothetical protein
MKAWCIDDCEWVAAETAEEARDWYQTVHNPGHVVEELPREAPLTQMMLWGDDPKTDKRVTFAEAIRRQLEAGEKPPMWLAGLDY